VHCHYWFSWQINYNRYDGGDVDELKAYTGIAAEVLADERAHKLFIAEQERLAVGHISQNF